MDFRWYTKDYEEKIRDLPHPRPSFRSGAFLFRAETMTFAFDVRSMLAASFFSESMTISDLKNTFTAASQGFGKVRIAIFPGHDDESWGASFGETKEADMNADLAEALANYLRADPEFEVFLTRNRGGYNPVFLIYMREQEAAIRAFVSAKKREMKDLIAAGVIHEYNGVEHNTATRDTVLKLYAINKWANENDIDIVLHIHFNDYPGRGRTTAGRYAGFAVYIPEKQYSNAKVSRAIGEALFGRLSHFYPSSNLPKENQGVVEDQELIAVGSYNTLDAAGLLVEYGYIYEPQFAEETIRKAVIQDLAYQTYLGIHDFFGSKRTEALPKSAFLPHDFEGELSEGARGKTVLPLQAALVLESVYPASGRTRYDCPISGRFGPCTKEALAAFEKKHLLESERGRVGEATREKLRALYGTR